MSGASRISGHLEARGIDRHGRMLDRRELLPVKTGLPNVKCQRRRASERTIEFSCTLIWGSMLTVF